MERRDQVALPDRVDHPVAAVVPDRADHQGHPAPAVRLVVQVLKVNLGSLPGVQAHRAHRVRPAVLERQGKQEVAGLRDRPGKAVVLAPVARRDLQDLQGLRVQVEVPVVADQVAYPGLLERQGVLVLAAPPV